MTVRKDAMQLDPRRKVERPLNHQFSNEFAILFGKPSYWETFCFIQLRDVNGYATKLTEIAKARSLNKKTIYNQLNYLEKNLGLIQEISLRPRTVRLTDKGKTLLWDFIISRLPLDKQKPFKSLMSDE